RSRARAHVRDAHVLLQRRHALDRAECRARLRRAALDDARLVEMNVRLDQAGTGEASAGIMHRRIGRDVRLDRDDAAGGDADVVRRALAVGEPRIADDEVHREAGRYSTLMSAALITGHHLSISAL